jgi:hypothetical protein
VEGRKKKKFKKNGNIPTNPGIDLRPVGDRWSQAGFGSTPGLVELFLFFLKFFYLEKKNFWKFGRWARAFRRMDVQHPHFLKLAPTLGSANSSKIHGEWRFHFFPKKIKF